MKTCNPQHTDYSGYKNAHNLVTMTRKSMCHIASQGFDSPYFQYNGSMIPMIGKSLGLDTISGSKVLESGLLADAYSEL